MHHGPNRTAALGQKRALLVSTVPHSKLFNMKIRKERSADGARCYTAIFFSSGQLISLKFYKWKYFYPSFLSFFLGGGNYFSFKIYFCKILDFN